VDLWQNLDGSWTGDRFAPNAPATSLEIGGRDFGNGPWNTLRIYVCMPDESPTSTVGWLSDLLEMRMHGSALVLPMDDDISLSFVKSEPMQERESVETTILVRVCDAWRAWRNLKSKALPPGWRHDKQDEGIVGSPVGEFFFLRNTCGLRLYVMEWVPEVDSPPVRTSSGT
jgi:hypothetical protein